MSPKYLILGIPDGGLFLVRQLRKQWPQSTIFAIGQPRDIGQYSNCIDRFYSAGDENEFCHAVQHAYNDMEDGEIMAYCCSNPMLEWVVRHKELFDLFSFENPYSFYQTIMDKRQVSLLCDECGVRHPQEFPLSTKDVNSLPYPVVVKPLEKMVDVPIKKCTYISSSQAMGSFLMKMETIHAKITNMVCQQAIAGDNRWEYGYGGYFQDGEPLIDICFHQFRQHPQGLCTYVREITDEKLSDDIRNFVKLLLHKIHVNGFIEFDIKQDSETKLLYLLDINPRPWRSSDMLTVKLGNSTIFHPVINNQYVEWIYPLKALFSKKNPNNISKRQCIVITGNQHFQTYVSMSDKNDPNPSKQQKKRAFKAFFNTMSKYFFLKKKSKI